MSATAQLMGNKTGYKNKEPRLNKRNLPPGLPHRMVATHEALYDIFPAYAITAALAASTPFPPSQTINALVLHVFLKLAVFSPAYLLDIDVGRTTHTKVWFRAQSAVADTISLDVPAANPSSFVRACSLRPAPENTTPETGLAVYHAWRLSIRRLLRTRLLLPSSDYRGDRQHFETDRLLKAI
ncbi:hypothetical protein B0H13DRAFT_2650624 [Mycena leptocephala]|nr:hypothetical protein B0H13DRAFT_2650624 [Mycena leptocephala]